MIVVRADSLIESVNQLAGKIVGLGAVDSPQATLPPLAYRKAAGVQVAAHRFDVDVGSHRDHIAGERDAARALMASRVEAACMIDANYLLFMQEGTLVRGRTRIPSYGHCSIWKAAVDALNVYSPEGRINARDSRP